MNGVYNTAYPHEDLMEQTLIMLSQFGFKSALGWLGATAAHRVAFVVKFWNISIGTPSCSVWSVESPNVTFDHDLIWKPHSFKPIKCVGRIKRPLFNILPSFASWNWLWRKWSLLYWPSNTVHTSSAIFLASLSSLEPSSAILLAALITPMVLFNGPRPL